MVEAPWYLGIKPPSTIPRASNRSWEGLSAYGAPLRVYAYMQNKMASYNESLIKDREKAIVTEEEGMENDCSTDMRNTKWS